MQHRLDLYCVISGRFGGRGKMRDEAIEISMNYDAFPDIAHVDDQGEASLALFFLALNAVLNSIDLGRPDFLRYVQLLHG